MSTTQYVLSANFFGYNDECFYVCGHRIQQIFTDHKQALQTWKQLEVAAAREYPLDEIESFFNASTDFLQQMDQFVFERCGKRLLHDGQHLQGDPIPDDLSDEDTFEFVQRAQMNSYQLYTLTPQDHFYVVYDCLGQTYLMIHDECSSSLVYAQDPTLLTEQLSHLLYEQPSPYLLSGTIESLTDQPTLLQQIIQQSKNLRFDANRAALLILDYDGAALASINGLLKTPLYEIRQLTAQQVMDLEASLIEEISWDDYE